VNVWKHTAASDGHSTEKLVELLIVAHGELKMARNDAGFFVVAGSVASKFEDLSAEVLENGSEVNRSAGTDTGSVLALLDKAANATNWELKSSLGRLGRRLPSGLATAASFSSFASLSFARHRESLIVF
jgi:hypothetical protein